MIMIGNTRAVFMSIATSIAWSGTAAAADCVAYIDARAVHDEAVAEAEAVYEKNAGTHIRTSFAEARKLRELAERLRQRRVAIARRTWREEHAAAGVAQRKAWAAANALKGKSHDEAIKAAGRTFSADMGAAAEKFKAARYAALDGLDKADKLIEREHKKYVATFAPHRTALEGAKKQARTELESKYIEIYSAGRDVSGYRRESVLKAAQGEFLNLCSQ